MLEMTTETRPVPFMDLARQHDRMGTGLHDAFERVLAHGGFTLGPEVEAFEREFASYVGVAEGVGVATGTDALHLALRSLGIGAGDEVITAANTFAATAEAILMAGARPVFVDIDPTTHLMDLDAVEPAISVNTAAIIPVHLYGQCVDMTAVRSLADKYELAVIEDACQAHGASRNGIGVGAASDAACFSFYPSKNLGAIGDGGIVVTDRPEVAESVRLLRNHGEDASRLHTEPGYCARLHGLQSAFLREKLPYLDEWNRSRQQAAAAYDKALASLPVVRPSAARGAEHVYHLYVVRVQDRDRVRAELAERGVQSGIHYAVPLHLEPAFAHLGFGAGDFPHAEKAASEILSLPMFPYLSDEEVFSVATALGEVARA